MRTVRQIGMKTEVVGLLLLGFAAFLTGPRVLKLLLNRYLKKSTALRGHVGRVSWNPFRGRIVADQVQFETVGEGTPSVSGSLDHAVLRLSTLKALRGRVSAWVEIDHPNILWRRQPGFQPFPADFAQRVFSLPSIHIHSVRMTDGTFRATNIPGYDGAELRLDRVNLDAENIVTRREISPSSLATMKASAWMPESGRVETFVTVDPLSSEPLVDAEVRLDGPDLPVGKVFRALFGSSLTSRLTADGLASAQQSRLPIPKPAPHWDEIFTLSRDAARDWWVLEGPRMGAALSYYTVFSLAPLILLAVAVAGLVFGQDAARGQVSSELQGLMGAAAASTVESMVEAAWKPATGIAATIIGIVSLTIGASAVMVELKTSLNKIWGTTSATGIVGAIKGRLLAISGVLSIGFLLLASLLVSAAISAAGKYVGGILPVPAAALQILNLTASAAITTVLFAILFRTLPDVNIAWRDVWLGSLFTMILFVAGKQALGIYIGRTMSASAYGAAGSVLILLVWVYYSAHIFYLGASFTRLYAQRFGSGAGESLSNHPSQR